MTRYASADDHRLHGLSNHGIAKPLQISLPTVALRLCNARRKLDAKSREQAVALVVKQGLVSLGPRLPDLEEAIHFDLPCSADRRRVRQRGDAGTATRGTRDAHAQH
jgi:hypothetical protein